MPLILPGNVGSATAATGFNVDNSCRFDGSSSYLQKTYASGQNKTFSISTWIKRSSVGDAGAIWSGYHNATNYLTLAFKDDDALRFQNVSAGVNMNFTTNRLFRDVSAWMHILAIVDTTDGTAGDRQQIFINGVRETSFSTSTAYAEDAAAELGATDKENIVGRHGSGDDYFDGYMAEHVFIDGLALAADQFGEFDSDNGIWKPIDVSGLTFGTNGYYLDFKASGNLGNDANGGTDLSENGLAATDQSIDTCTNNFATLNSLAIGSFPVLSEGNLNVRSNSDAEYGNIIGTFSTSSSGKWYYEIKVISKTGTSPWGGLIVDDDPKAGIGANGGANSAGGTSFSAPTFAFQSNGKVSQGGSEGSTYTSFATGDIISFSIDMDNGACYIAKNGTYMNSGNPASAGSKTGAIITWTAGSVSGFLPAISVYGAGTSTGSWSEVSMNFGSPAFAISSGNTDGDGYGNFEYAVPSGYYSLNTKNLAEYG